ncbi:DUF4055 domain-containing protein [Pseudomonas cichorii]|nr:DUF4055 domain-containing protein [Pseudomonas cichorii]
MGTLFCDPPFKDLAHLNIQHWQSKPDQDNILHVARVPILFGSGIAEGTTIKISVGSALICNVEGRPEVCGAQRHSHRLVLSKPARLGHSDVIIRL